MTELLKKLISIESISGNEGNLINFISSYLKDKSINSIKIGNNLAVAFGSGKNTLMIAAHVDTVPVVEGWSHDPFRPIEQNGKIFGLGAADNKAAVASLISVISELSGSRIKGKLIFVLTSEEESTLKGIEQVLSYFGENIDSAIIAEPTLLKPCIAQKGLVKIKLTTKGKSAHAAFPELGENAIIDAARDIQKINLIKFPKNHSLLGIPKISVTEIKSGIKHNIIPDKCESILDIRSTPIYGNDHIIKLIKKIAKSQVEVLSNRLKPVETDKSSEIVKIAELASDSASQGFPAVSEMCFFNCPAVVIGPGNLEVAHKPDEFVEISQYEKSKKIYAEIIRRFLK